MLLDGPLRQKATACIPVLSFQVTLSHLKFTYRAGVLCRKRTAAWINASLVERLDVVIEYIAIRTLT